MLNLAALQWERLKLELDGPVDGPVAGNRWRHAGDIIQQTMPPGPWRLVDFLWRQPERVATFDQLKLPVYDDVDHEADAVAYGSYAHGRQ